MLTHHLKPVFTTVYRVCCTALMTLALIAPSQAEPLALDKLRFKTQHDVPVKVPDNIRLILFAHDMDGKDIVDAAITDKTSDYLPSHNSAFVANISGMPSLIARLFAYPAMRKENYAIWLDEKGTQTADWAQQENTVTVYTLNNLNIVTTEFVTEPERLLELIEAIDVAKPEITTPAKTPEEITDPIQ